MCVSLVGLNKLLAIISPMFTAFYAVGLSLLLIILLRKVTPNDTANRGALYVVTVFAVAELLIAYVPNMPVVSTVVHAIPLQTNGFGWIVPFIVGYVVGAVIGMSKKKAEA